MVEQFRAQIEGVSFGKGFLVVEGWAVHSDGAAIDLPLSLNIDGTRHPVTGLYPRSDLAISGVSNAAAAFCLDLHHSMIEGPPKLISLEIGGDLYPSASINPSGAQLFAPEGSLDIVSEEKVTGWIFDPGLWHDVNTSDGAVLVVDLYRLPITLNVRRHELSFSSAKAGRTLGFQINLINELEQSFGAAAVDKLRESVSCLVTLESRGQTIASQTLNLQEQRALAVPFSSRGATRDETGALARASQVSVTSSDPDGYIDFFSYSESLGGWLFAGWVRHAALDDGVNAAKRVRIDQKIHVPVHLATYPRTDVEALGLGLLGFAPAGAESLMFHLVELEGRSTATLRNSATSRAVDEIVAVQEMRSILRGVESGSAASLAKIVARPVYEGSDTVNQLAAQVHLEIDELIVAPRGGVMIIGWFVDPAAAVKAIRFRSPKSPAESLMDRWVRVARPDIRDAFAASLALQGEDWGFHVFAPGANIDTKRGYLEVELNDGTIAFKPLKEPTRSGRAGIVRAVSDVRLTTENLKRTCSDVLAPAVLAINRHQLEGRQGSSEFVAGSPPVRPRCSIIVPLYGRLDFLNYQVALFSEHDEGLDEFIFVLDQPERREEFLNLARSVYQRYKLPIRLVLPQENLGFAGASNEGLEAARGEYICFLNSDVMPKTPDWVAKLILAKEAASNIGLIGARLLFEDNTVQHVGMDLERKEGFANMLFPFHPHKGRLLPATDDVRVVPLVTGALMLMRRELALECGGFDTDYVIGDFEDADLCMQIRERGYDCAVHEGVELFHLERQSQGSSSNSWRQNVTLLNAWTFNRRWDSQFTDRTAPSGPTQIG